MKKLKSIITMTACLALVLGLAACGKANETEQEETQPAESTSEAEKETETKNGTDIAVIYFSATGNTRGVAEKIAAIENADIYEIIAAEPYSSDDLNYNDSNSRTTKEQNDKSVRPEIAGETIDLSGYSKIYIGYPIWWGEEPRIMDTFVESYDFGDIVIIPFCTSGSSGIGRSGMNLAENAGSGDWKDGERFQSSISDADLQAWIDSYH